MEQRQRKELKKRFGRLGWALIASQLVLLAVVYGLEFVQVRVLAWLHPDWTAEVLSRAVYDSGWTLILGALAALVPLRLLLPLEPPRTWVLREVQPTPPVRMAVFFLLVMGLQLTASVLTMPFEALANALGGSFYEASESASAASVTPSMLFYTVVFAPFCEEMTYRGFVLQMLRPHGKTFAIMVAALLFGLMHGNVIQLPMAILCGSLFGYVALEYSLPAVMVLHSLTNLSVEAIGWMNAADEILGGTINAALTSFGLIALLLCVMQYKQQLMAYWRAGRAGRGLVRCLLTAPPMLLLIAYLVVLTGLSITPL